MRPLATDREERSARESAPGELDEAAPVGYKRHQTGRQDHMNGTIKPRTHDLLWAALIVIGLGVLLVAIHVVTRQDALPDEQLAAEANQALARGDRAADQLDCDAARQHYQQALDLLRSVPGSLDEKQAAVHIKILNTYMIEGRYQKARERLSALRALYPAFRSAELTALEREIDVRLHGPPAEAPTGDRAGEAPPPKAGR